MSASPLAALDYARRALRRRFFIDVTITEPPDGVVLERDVPVPMRDGVRLRINVFRPDDEPRPVILCAHPYGKDRMPRKRRLRKGYTPTFQYYPMATAPLTHSAWTTWEAPDPAFWTQRGYVVVNADLRGYGTSEGSGELLSGQEGPDLYDLIEWIALQPWSSGRVGMSGVSYLAISQYAAAAERPPHLTAICPWEGLVDAYRDFGRPGGVRENGFMTMWNAGSRLEGHPSELGQQSKSRPFADEWWASLNRRVDDIEVPTLVCGSFSDHNLHTRGSFELFRRIRSEHRWLYTHRGPKWATYYSAEGLRVQAQFFDHFLRDEDTGLDAVPPVRLEVREDADTITSVRGAQTWPLPDTNWQTLHLRAGADASTGTLSVEPPRDDSVTSFAIRRGRASFTHRFTQDTELAGPMLLRLTLAAENADDVAVFAGVRKLRDGVEVGFNGSFGFPEDLVTHGILLASHRHTDPARSLSYLPFHTHDRREPLRPGQPVKLEIGLLPSATLFRAGEDLRLDVQGRWFFSKNPLIGQFPPSYEEPVLSGRCLLFTGPDQVASLTIPVTGRRPERNDQMTNDDTTDSRTALIRR